MNCELCQGKLGENMANQVKIIDRRIEKIYQVCEVCVAAVDEFILQFKEDMEGSKIQPKSSGQENNQMRLLEEWK
jgi:hypothetical protein